MSQLPVRQIRAAAKTAIQKLRDEYSICSELADFAAHSSAPVQLVRQLKAAQRAMKRHQLRVRECEVRLEALMLDADDSDDEDADVEKQVATLRRQKHEAKKLARIADQQVHAALIALSTEQRHWPEVTKSLAKLGLPVELLPLWRPGRDTSYYEEYNKLQGALARPGNRIMRAVRNGHVTVVKEYLQDTAQGLQTCLREARLLYRLRHPGIVKICSIFTLNRSGGGTIFCIEMPFYAHGQTDAFVKREKPNLNAVKLMFLEVVRALGHLHGHGVVHRDVKPANILVDATGKCCISDFDISVQTKERTTVRYTRSASTLRDTQGSEGMEMSRQVYFKGPRVRAHTTHTLTHSNTHSHFFTRFHGARAGKS